MNATLVTEVHRSEVDLHATLAITDGHTGRKDDSTLRRSALFYEIGLAEMSCTTVELNDINFLRRILPQRQDSAEHDECYISGSALRDKCDVFAVVHYMAVYDVIVRRQRLPRREVFAEGVEKKLLHQGQILGQLNIII